MEPRATNIELTKDCLYKARHLFCHTRSVKSERIRQGSNNNSAHITITVALNLYGKLSPRPGEIQFLARKDFTKPVVLRSSYKRVIKKSKDSVRLWNLACQT